MILALEAVSKSFAGLQALAGVSFEMGPSEITAVIGPNGAGKTTLFNVVTGVFPPTGGAIRFLGKDIAGLPPERIVGLGVSRTFQHVRLFRTLTVLENVMLARHQHSRSETVACGLRLPRARRIGRISSAGLIARPRPHTLSPQTRPQGAPKSTSPFLKTMDRPRGIATPCRGAV